MVVIQKINWDNDVMECIFTIESETIENSIKYNGKDFSDEKFNDPALEYLENFYISKVKYVAKNMYNDTAKWTGEPTPFIWY